MRRRDFLKMIVGGVTGTALITRGRSLLAYDPESKRPQKAEAISHSDFTKKALKLTQSHSKNLSQPELIQKIIQGSIQEDNPITNCVRHFYTPNRPETSNGLILPGLNDGRLDALTRATQLWFQALDYHKKGNFPEAYYTLGRVCHLLEDMASPEHVYLVNHAVINIKTKGGQMLDQEFLKKLARHLNLNEIDLTQSTYQIGSTYEKACAKISLEEILTNQKLTIIEKDSLKELFDNLAYQSFIPDIAQVIQKHLRLKDLDFFNNPRISNRVKFNENGSYHNPQFTAQETKAIAASLAPQVIGHIAGLLISFEKETQSKKDPEKLLEQYKKFHNPHLMWYNLLKLSKGDYQRILSTQTYLQLAKELDNPYNLKHFSHGHPGSQHHWEDKKEDFRRALILIQHFKNNNPKNPTYLKLEEHVVQRYQECVKEQRHAFYNTWAAAQIKQKIDPYTLDQHHFDPLILSRIKKIS